MGVLWSETVVKKPKEYPKGALLCDHASIPSERVQCCHSQFASGKRMSRILATPPPISYCPRIKGKVA